MKMIATTALILTAGVFHNTASADHSHWEDLAFTLKQQAALACQEVRYGFRHSPAFPHLYRDFYELYTLADHVHEVARNQGDLCHLKKDVDQVDAAFHHAEDMLAQWGRAPGNGGCYHIRRLERMMRQMERTIHHLQDDLDADLSPVGVAPPLPPGQIGTGGPVLMPPIQNDPRLGPSPGRFPNQSPGVGFRGRKGNVAFSIRIGR